MADRYPIIAGAEAWSSPGHGPRARAGVLLVHGFTGCPVTMRPLGEALAERGFAIEVPRLPGHGTHVRDMLHTRYPDWRGEVERVLASLQKRVDRVVMVGLSMGGTIVLDIASRGAPVSGVVSINAPMLNRTDIGSRISLWPLTEILFPLVPGSFAGLACNDGAKPGIDEKAYRFLPTASGNSLLRELPRIRGQLASLRIPALIAYSLQDHSVPPQNSKAILRMIGSEDVTELPLERSYHLATLDYDFELLLEKDHGVCGPRRQSGNFKSDRVTAAARKIVSAGPRGRSLLRRAVHTSCVCAALVACSRPLPQTQSSRPEAPAAFAEPSRANERAPIGPVSESHHTSRPVADIVVPVGEASAGVYIERGQRQPLWFQGRIRRIGAPEGDAGLESWTTLELLAPGPKEIRFFVRPPGIALPFAEGDFVKGSVDCRRGGWSRVCDAVFRGADHRLLLAIAGSGNPTLIDDWTIQRGPLAFSESRARGPKSVRHTYTLVVRHARQSVTVPPHEWQILRANDGAWLVEGHAISWEGVRPPDAPDYLHYAILRAPKNPDSVH